MKKITVDPTGRWDSSSGLMVHWFCCAEVNDVEIGVISWGNGAICSLNKLALATCYLSSARLLLRLSVQDKPDLANFLLQQQLEVKWIRPRASLIINV